MEERYRRRGIAFGKVICDSIREMGKNGEPTTLRDGEEIPIFAYVTALEEVVEKVRKKYRMEGELRTIWDLEIYRALAQLEEEK